MRIAILFLLASSVSGATIDLEASFPRDVLHPARLGSKLHFEAGLSDSSGNRLLWPEFETSALKLHGSAEMDARGVKLHDAAAEYFLRVSAGQTMNLRDPATGEFKELDFGYLVAGILVARIPGEVKLEEPGPQRVEVESNSIAVSWRISGPNQDASGIHLISLGSGSVGRLDNVGTKPGELATLLFASSGAGSDPYPADVWWSGTIDGIPLVLDGRLAGTAILVPEPNGLEVLIPGILVIVLVYGRMLVGEASALVLSS